MRVFDWLLLIILCFCPVPLLYCLILEMINPGRSRRMRRGESHEEPDHVISTLYLNIISI